MKPLHMVLWGLAGVALGYFAYSTLTGLPVVGTLFTSAQNAGNS